MLIIDSQIHIWAADRPDRPWRSHGAERAHLPKPFGYEDLLIEMGKAGVDRAVLIPPGWEGDRVDFALEGAGKYHDRFRVMGRISIEKPEARALVPAWMQQPGMAGVRLSFHQQHNSPWLTDGTADWFWPAAEAAGIPVMVFAPSWPDRLMDIARRHPRLRLIVDHMGLYREKDREAADTIVKTARMAACPNIFVKITTAPMYSTEAYPFRNLHEPIRRLIEAFGPRRCFWGTDLTRLRGRVPYRQCVTMFTEEMTFLTSDDLEWIMGRSLAECLGWSLES